MFSMRGQICKFPDGTHMYRSDFVIGRGTAEHTLRTTGKLTVSAYQIGGRYPRKWPRYVESNGPAGNTGPGVKYRVRVTLKKKWMG